MANFELRFFDCTDTSSYVIVEKTKYAEGTTMNALLPEGCISIRGYDVYTGKDFEIEFDKSTAIKLAKTLRTEINKITESEVSNG